MNRACCRLRTTLTGPAKKRVDRIAFTIAARSVEIATNETAEGVAAEVQRKGRVSVPYTVIDGVITTLPYFGYKKIQVGFSNGKMRVDSMVFHNRMIVLSDFPTPQSSS